MASVKIRGGPHGWYPEVRHNGELLDLPLVGFSIKGGIDRPHTLMLEILIDAIETADGEAFTGDTVSAPQSGEGSQ